jgi:hypothetical protein
MMNSERTCPDGRCDCGGLLPRRDFLKLTGLAAAAAAVADGMPVMAGPFENENEYLQSIPHDKRLDPEWLRSLYERGEKETYRDPAALRHIGMPVGGLFAGTVYLGGDGRLWLWDVFNRDQEGIAPRSVPHQGQQVPTRNGANYIQPAAPQSPFEIGFALRIGERLLPLDASGFADIAFDGRYPTGRVSYRDDSLPVAVRLEAFSPFIPLNVEDSSLPVTVMSFTVENVSAQTVEYQLAGHLENAIALYHRDRPGKRINRVVIEPGLTRLDCLAAAVAVAKTTEREEIVFADFETAEYRGWTAEGEAFGAGPIAMKDIPEYQGDVGGRGQRVVNSHASAPGSGVLEKDSRLGTLTSDPFTIERNFINFLIGGGGHAGKTCMNLIVDDRVVASATGRSNNRMGPNSFPTAHLQGKTARLQIVDQVSGAWGNIGVDHIVFSDRSTDPSSDTLLTELPDFGTMSLALLDSGEHVAASASQLGGADDPQTASLAEAACRPSWSDRWQRGGRSNLANRRPLPFWSPGIFRISTAAAPVPARTGVVSDTRTPRASPTPRPWSATWPAISTASPVRPGGGSRPGTIRRCPIGCWTARWPTPARWRPPRATGLRTGGSGPGKASVAVPERVRTSGITRRRRAGCFRRSNASTGGASTSGWHCTPTAASGCVRA